MHRFDSVFAQCALFEGITPEELHTMLACIAGRLVEVEKGQVIVQEGDPANTVGLVLRGAVQLVREDYYGNRSIVAHIAPSELFGESYACADISAMPVSIVATQESTVLLMDCRRLTTSCCNACSFHSRIIYNLLGLVAKKNLVYDQKIRILSQRSTREKMMAYLLSQAKLHGSNCFSIPYDRQALADYLEVERSGLSAEISKLRREGVLESEKNQFRLR